MVYYLITVIVPDQPEINETSDILEREVANSERMIEAFLCYVRPMAAVTQPVHGNRVIRGSLHSLSSSDEGYCYLHLGENLSEITGDSRQLIQVSRNFVENGARVMSKGEKPEIRTSGGKERNSETRIEDNGIGIAGRDMLCIFERFFTRKTKGIGSGLAIVKALQEFHGGIVEIETRLGEETEFSVRLQVEDRQRSENRCIEPGCRSWTITGAFSVPSLLRCNGKAVRPKPPGVSTGNGLFEH